MGRANKVAHGKSLLLAEAVDQHNCNNESLPHNPEPICARGP